MLSDQPPVTLRKRFYHYRDDKLPTTRCRGLLHLGWVLLHLLDLGAGVWGLAGRQPLLSAMLCVKSVGYAVSAVYHMAAVDERAEHLLRKADVLLVTGNYVCSAGLVLAAAAHQAGWPVDPGALAAAAAAVALGLAATACRCTADQIISWPASLFPAVVVATSLTIFSVVTWDHGTFAEVVPWLLAAVGAYAVGAVGFFEGMDDPEGPEQVWSDHDSFHLCTLIGDLLCLRLVTELLA